VAENQLSENWDPPGNSAHCGKNFVDPKLDKSRSAPWMSTSVIKTQNAAFIVFSFSCPHLSNAVASGKCRLVR